MPDLNSVIHKHELQMRNWWTRPEYIAARKAFIKRRPVCDRCGRKATTPGHSREDYERGFEGYLAAVISDKCESLCSTCNRMERSGRKPCPVCVVKFHQGLQDKIHYITEGQEMCRYCEDPNYVEKAKARKDKLNRQRNANNRVRYRKYHPKKEVVNGVWIVIK